MRMKDSGIEWIGKIPDDWKVSTIKHEYFFQTGWTPDTTNENYFIGENIWVNISDMKEKVIYDSEKHISDEAVQLASMNISPKGSLMYAFKLSVGAVSFCGRDMYTNEAIATFLSGKNSLRFLYYMAPIFVIKNANENIYGAKILNQKLIKNAKIIIPPIEVQERIADYLDRKCSQIDSIIAKQHEVIEKLKEYKQSLIIEAVTKGLNPDAPMKDSGIKWIGKFPMDWKLLQFRRVLFERIEKNNPVRSTERLSLSIDKGVTLYAEKTTNLDRFKDDYSQYKLAYEGDLVMNSMNMIVGASGISNFFGCVSPAYYTFYDMEPNHITAKYCEYIFRSKSMQRILFSLGKGIYAIERGDDRVNTCRLKVSREDLKKLYLPIPCIEEQKKIVEYLDTKSEAIESLIFKKQKIINKLITYKKSLIYEVVTGKKEV